MVCDVIIIFSNFPIPVMYFELSPHPPHAMIVCKRLDNSLLTKLSDILILLWFDEIFASMWYLCINRNLFLMEGTIWNKVFNGRTCPELNYDVNLMKWVVFEDAKCILSRKVKKINQIKRPKKPMLKQTKHKKIQPPMVESRLLEHW